MDQADESTTSEQSATRDERERSSEGKGDLKDLAALATAVLGVFTALAGGATVGGGFDRISRDYPLQVALGLFSFTVATVLASWSTVVGRTHRALRPGSPRRGALSSLIITAVLLFIAGLAFSFWAMLGTAGNRSRPSMSVAARTSPDGEAVLEAEIRASGLNAREYLRIKVMQVAGKAVLANEQPIYLATQGPRSSGEVDVKFVVPLPRGGSDAVLIKVWQTDREPPCPLDRIGSRGTSGCLRVSVPRGS